MTSYEQQRKDNALQAQARAMHNIATASEYIKRGYFLAAHTALQHASGQLFQAEQYEPTTERQAETPYNAERHRQALAIATEQAKQDRAGGDDLDPERVETIADLRERIKAGDPTARELVNDLIADCPTQCTAWIQREDLDRWTADDYTPEQQGELWEMLKTADILDLDGEIRNVCEIYDTEQGAE